MDLENIQWTPNCRPDGTFVQDELFERIWCESHLNHKFGSEKCLTIGEYIDYHIWEELNYTSLMEKYLPNAGYSERDNPNIVFHGGCVGCVSQLQHGVSRCTGCQYFKVDWGLPDLSIDGEWVVKKETTYNGEGIRHKFV